MHCISFTATTFRRRAGRKTDFLLIIHTWDLLDWQVTLIIRVSLKMIKRCSSHRRFSSSWWFQRYTVVQRMMMKN